jgi:hypothetical protein
MRAARLMRQHAALESLEREVARLSLRCGALWSLLRERHGMTDSRSGGPYRDDDLRGATRSGPPPAMRACKSCGRSVRADRRWCLYCGARVVPPTWMGQQHDRGTPRLNRPNRRVAALFVLAPALLALFMHPGCSPGHLAPLCHLPRDTPARSDL